MGKTTKKALLVAPLSQKAPKDDSAFFFLASCICTNLILFGAAVQSTFLFRIGVGLIVVFPMLRGPYKEYIASKEEIYRIVLILGIVVSVIFLLALATSFGDLVTISFLGIIAIPIIEVVIKRNY